MTTPRAGNLRQAAVAGEKNKCHGGSCALVGGIDKVVGEVDGVVGTKNTTVGMRLVLFFSQTALIFHRYPPQPAQTVLFSHFNR